MNTDLNYKAPSLMMALFPIVALISMLSASVYFFGENSSYGPNQIALLITAGIALSIGFFHGQRWEEQENGITQSISMAIPPTLILLAVGSLIGTWIMAGIVPTLIVYGLEFLNPTYFYFSACFLCALVSLVIGSSWTTAGTIGVALIGVSQAFGLSLPVTAGAIISGAYFGDKLSPLSDTTNLAPAVANSELFQHIRHMLWTTIPSISIALLLFLVLGFQQDSTVEFGKIDSFIAAMHQEFTIHWSLLLPVMILFFMIIKKFPAFPAIFISALIGGVFAILFQTPAVAKFVGADSVDAAVLIKGVWTALSSGFSASTGIAEIDSLLSRGGMEGMLNTVWLILSAMVFGGAMEVTGLLQRITLSLLKFTSSSRSLLLSTIATCIGTNIITSDQFISIVLPGRMYQMQFKQYGIESKNLSRILEDSGTVTSALVPWNTCGAYMSQTLGVATLAYLPYCFFNLLSPMISAIYAITGFTITKSPDFADATLAAEAA